MWASTESTIEDAFVSSPDAPRLLLFGVGGRMCALELDTVREIVPFRRTTRLPGAPSFVTGLINLRGQIVMAIDLRRRLGLPRRADGALPINVVIRTSEGGVSLLVDEIGEVIEVSESSFEAPPDTLRGAVRSMILGVHKLAGNLLHVLDSGSVCQVLAATDATTPGC